MIEIQYNRVIDYGFMGRNGTFKISGLYIVSRGLDLEMCPLTSRGKIGMCHIYIPKDKIDELCEQLQKMK